MMEEILKLAVNYGLGIVFSIGIAVAFFSHLRDDKKQSLDREERLMRFLESHSLVTQRLIAEHDARAVAACKTTEDANRFQREEHTKILEVLDGICTSLIIMDKTGQINKKG